MTSPAIRAIEIRPARESDAASIAILSKQLGYPASETETRERLQRIASETASDVYAAVSSGGEVLGWLHVMRHISLESGPRAEIMGLVVDENSRGSGVGRELMMFAERWAREHGCVAVNLRTNVIRERAHAFYERLGYKHIKTQKCLRKSL